MPEPASFVHLHNHSHYSLLDGACRIPDMVATAQKMGMSAIALTDHGNMFGAIGMYQACREASADCEARGLKPIKPIIGMEAYIVPDGKQRGDRVKVDGDYGYHLLLLAENRAGYQNLMQLSSLGYLEGFYYKPRIDKECLAKHSDGLIATSTDIGGEIPQRILKGDLDEARRLTGLYIDIFGRENYYFELQNHGMPEEKTLNAEIIKLAREFERPLVATNDVHYTLREDAEAHDVLLCIQTGKRRSDEKRLRFPNDEFYLKTPQEMAALFADFPEALATTLEIAERCNLEIPLGTYHLPTFPVPDGQDATEYFRKLVYDGLHERFGETLSEEVIQRAEHELRVIAKMGFTGYLLIVWDLVRYARENGIPVGPGRGSAAGSLVSYAMAITNLDPLKYELLFERFINEGRNEMPDIDIDFCQARRGEMLEYVARRYGRENVAQIITFGTMAARAAIRDVGRVQDIPLYEVNRIATSIPPGPGQALRGNLENNADFKAFYHDPEHPEYRDVIDIAMRIEGLVRQPSTHAAGVVIADRELTAYCPLYKAAGEQTVTTQYDMKMVAAVGLLKIDFLGLQTLTVIRRARDLIEQLHGVSLDMDAIPLDDPRVYELFARGETQGIFQFESEGMKRMLREAKPNCLDDLIALNAMYRPGPMENIATFIARKHGREAISYLHPRLEPILAPTYGIIVYQEQVMLIANALAGFSLSEADTLRKAMGKKNSAIMAEYRGYFVEGCLKNGIERGRAERLGDLIAKFALYGFNKSHAAAYALVAYQTAYLKANYPTEFMAAVLTLDMGTTDKVAAYIEESGRMGVKVLGPSVNESGVDFTVVRDRVIRYALAAIKGCGVKAMASIAEARAAGEPFRGLYDFCERIDARAVNRAAVESLVKAGAFDEFGHRAQLLEVLDEALQVGVAATRDRVRGQATMFDMFGGEAAGAGDEPALPNVPRWEMSTQLEQEKAVLGLFLSGHPLRPHRKLITELASHELTQIQDLEAGVPVTVGVRIARVRKTATRKGDRMAIVQLEGFANSRAEAVVFPRAYEKLAAQLIADALIFVQGTVNERDDTKSIIVEKIIPIGEAREALTYCVQVSLGAADKEEETDANLDALCAVAGEHPGQTPLLVRLAVPDGGQVLIEAGDELRVRPSEEFCAAVERFAGPDSVQLKPKTFEPAPRPGRRRRTAAG